MTILLLIPGLCLFIGGFLFIIGWHGRKVDDHPHCRKCRFDLFGSPDTKACPECGLDLTNRKAIRQGMRRMRKGLFGTGSALLIFFLTQAGVGIYLLSINGQLQEHKPLWFLTLEATYITGIQSDDAVAEIRRRQNAGELTKEETLSLVETALEHQADLDRPWRPEWGDLIERARLDVITTDEQWIRYAEQMLVDPYRFDMGPAMPLKEWMIVRLVSHEFRRAGTPEMTLMIVRENAVFSLGPINAEMYTAERHEIVGPSAGYSKRMVTGNKAERAELTPGQINATCTLTVSIYDQFFQPEKPIASKTFTIDGTFVLMNEQQYDELEEQLTEEMFSRLSVAELLELMDK